MTDMGDQLYRLAINASGEVRDKDGNLIGTHPVEVVFERPVTEAEAAAIVQAQTERNKE